MKPYTENIPVLYQNKGFKNFTTNSQNRENFAVCREFAIDSKRKKNSLLLFGKTGTGKTHLAIAVLKNFYTQKQTRCLFLNADEFFVSLNEKVKSDISKLEYIKQVLSYNCVLLDDLSFFNMTPAKQENLYLLINRAYMDQKSIIITSNCGLNELKNADMRIFSRLAEMCYLLKFDYEDFRLRRKPMEPDSQKTGISHGISARLQDNEKKV